MKKFFTPSRLLAAVLVFLLGLFLTFSSMYLLEHAETDPNSNVVFYELVSGSKNTSFDILWSSTENGDYSWINSSTFNGEVYYVPLINDRQYTLNGRPSNSGYYKGFRIYGTFLGSFDKTMTLSFSGMPFDFYEDDPYGSGISFYYKDQYQPDYVRVDTYYGVTSYNGENRTLELSVTWDADNITSQYGSQDTEYQYNIMVEFDFAPTLGSTAFSYLLYQYYGYNLNIVPVETFFSDTDLGNSLKALLYNNPVMPVVDFVNGNNITAFLGSSLGTVINPFLNLFYSNNVNPTWKALANFSFGMFVLICMIAFLRRAKSS